MATVSAFSLGRFFLTGTPSFPVDIPLAATEGMLAVPRYYGPTPSTTSSSSASCRDPAYGHATNIRSGLAVAGRTFTRGIPEGFGGIFVKTWRGKGVAKRLSKNVVNLGMKTGAGIVVVLAYPGLGVCRSVRAAARSAVRRGV